MDFLKAVTPLSICIFIIVSGCVSTDGSRFDHDHRSSTGDAKPASSNVEIGYMCPDLFEGHIFSCPTVPAIGLAADFSTDAVGGSLELSCTQNHGGICLSPAVEYSRGNESFGGVLVSGLAAKQQGEFQLDYNYSVIQARVQGKYGFNVSADSSLTLSPVAGPRLYRWSAIDCPFTSGCTETLLVLDVGLSVQYKNFGIDATTGLNGPDFAARLKYYFAR